LDLGRELTTRPEPPVSARCEWCGAEIGVGGKRVGRRALCRSCGAWTTDPPPDEAELDLAYEGWYRPSGGRFSGLGDGLLRRARGSVARRLDRLAAPGPILDVGAGDGALLDALRRRGRVAVGIDQHSSRPDVRQLELAELEGTWAAVVFWHSLEHLPGAGVALDRAVSVLEPDGVVAIAMPNPASLQAALFGERWFANDFPRHLVHVPPHTLLTRLRGLGMTIERVSYLRGGQVVFGWLHGFIDRLSGGRSLYDAIRRPEARERPLGSAERLGILLGAGLLLPVALLCAGFEVACRRGGSVYVEARGV
jgi:SAM-dependent methyltransferase